MMSLLIGWLCGALFAAGMARMANTGQAVPRWWARLIAARTAVKVSVSPDFAVVDRDLFAMDVAAMIEKARADGRVENLR
jgi:hypothetical protein